MSRRAEPPRYAGRTAARPCAQDRAEFAAWLALCQRLGVRSYCEVGSRHGDALWAAARTLPPGALVVAVDLPGGPWGRADSVHALRECVHLLRRDGYDARLVLGRSTAGDVLAALRTIAPQGVDAVFVDADHSAASVCADVAAYASRARRVLGFHDVAPDAPDGVGVPPVWAALRALVARTGGATAHEFVTEGARMGIGALAFDRPPSAAD